ncbi:MAG: pilus assembly protein [Acidiferrobacteraceae bacterium]|jgi:type IV pilus assembly protein PilY1
MKLHAAFRNLATGTALAVIAGLFAPPVIPVQAATTPTIPISQIPLSVAIPVHPQVLFAVGNSQSMDGDLGGAIMTGSGSLSAGQVSLYNSSSPVSYTVPSGFTPPVVPAVAGVAPYTAVNASGNLVDNSASRLNVAKAGLAAILQAYMGSTDFALEDYATSGTSLYSTWVYYMSPNGGPFTFANALPANGYTSYAAYALADPNASPAPTLWTINPCYQYTTASSSVSNNCSQIDSTLYGGTMAGYQYMQIGATSDEPDINDVLYASGGPAVYVDYGGTYAASGPNSGASINPPTSTPYTLFSLSNYNSGGISVGYNNAVPSANTVTGPTNAGYVPYSPQVMYVHRGFGYYVNSVTSNSGAVLVPMTSAGTQPTTSSISTAINTFTPYLAPETNNSSSSEIKALAYQSPIAGLVSGAGAYLQGLGVSTSACPPKQYVVLVTDGLPTMDLDGNLWPPLGSAAAQGYGVNAAFNADGSLNASATNDQALIDAVNTIAKLKTQGIETYVVGLGAGVDPSANPQAAAALTAMAIAGGTSAYFPAKSPSSLVSQLSVILNQIQAGSLSTASAAVNSTGLNTGSDVYEASYNTNWTGDLREFPIDASNGQVNTAASNAVWSAQTQLDTQASGTGWSTNRIIATWNPALSGAVSGASPGAGAPFRWGTTGTLSANSISPAQQLLLQPSDTLGQERLQYLRGDQAQQQSNGGPFRNRAHILGDIVDSNPIYVGAPDGPYASGSGFSTSFNSSYQSFQSTYANRQPVLYVGANDGMLHAFDPMTGKELFAFVPNGVFANLIDLTQPNYSHQFYVDGSPQAGDVQFADGTWHTLLVGGENAGGKSIYALDVTNPASLTTESALAKAVRWEFSGSGGGGMGYTYSTPALALTCVPSPGYQSPCSNANATLQGMFMAFFGNGYDSPSNHAILYAVNAQTGALQAKIDLCAVVSGACNPNLPDGLSSVVAANSDGIIGAPVDHVFAGDLQGNLWSINVSNSSPSKWTVRLLFRARDASGNPQPITTTPAVTLNPNYPNQLGLMVYFGTGQLLAASDLTSTQTQSFYGVWDKPTTSTSSVANAYTRSNLQSQVLTTISAATAGLPQAVRTVTNNCVYYSTTTGLPSGCTAPSSTPSTAQLGWYMDLPASGERVITDPRLESGAVVFTTNAPTSASSTQCSVGFNSWLMDVNYVNGGSFSQPELDVNGDYTINGGDQVTIGGTTYNPVGMSMGTVYSAAPTIISADLGAAHALKLITRSDQTIKSVQERGGGPTRVGWWQIIQ